MITKINRVHERALRIVFQDDTSTFEELFNKDNSQIANPSYNLRNKR